MNRHRLWIAAQLLFVVALVVFLGYALGDSWADAGPRLRDADPVDLAIAFALLAIYYLLFVVGWQWILRALSVRVSYSVALQSEMASMLAKYVPGGIWTPAARVLWLRRREPTRRRRSWSRRSSSRLGSRPCRACSCSAPGS